MNLYLVLTVKNFWVIKWYVDTVFSVHDGFRYHSGGLMRLGTGAEIPSSCKQKIITIGSTEA